MIEGNSVRATERMTGCSKNSIQKLTLEPGAACSEYMNRTLVNLKSERVQIDELCRLLRPIKRTSPRRLPYGEPALHSID